MSGLTPSSASDAPTPSTANAAPERSINYMLESMPIGTFHHRLLGICGLSFMADAMVRHMCTTIDPSNPPYKQEVSLLSFMAPCVGLDWDLTDAEVAGIAR